MDVGEGALRGREPRRQERGCRIGGWKPGFSCTESVIRREAPKDEVIALLSQTVRPLSANVHLPGGCYRAMCARDLRCYRAAPISLSSRYNYISLVEVLSTVHRLTGFLDAFEP